MIYRMRTGYPSVPEPFVVVLVAIVASSGQELRALWADKVDALGQRRHNAVGLGVGTRHAVRVTMYSYIHHISFSSICTNSPRVKASGREGNHSATATATAFVEGWRPWCMFATFD